MSIPVRRSISSRRCDCKQCQSIRLAKIIGNVALNDVDQREVIGESGCIQVFSEMIHRGEIGVGVNALASLCHNNPKNAEKFFHEDLFILCVENLPEDYRNSSKYYHIVGSLRLFRSLANDEAFGPSIGRHEKIVEFTLKILGDRMDSILEALALVQALAKHDEARSKLKDVKIRLKELLETHIHYSDNEHDDLNVALNDALKALDIATLAAVYQALD